MHHTWTQMGEGKQRRQQSDSTSMGGGKIIFYCSAEGVTHRIHFRGVRGHAPPGKFWNLDPLKRYILQLFTCKSCVQGWPNRSTASSSTTAYEKLGVWTTIYGEFFGSITLYVKCTGYALRKIFTSSLRITLNKITSLRITGNLKGPPTPYGKEHADPLIGRQLKER